MIIRATLAEAFCLLQGRRDLYNLFNSNTVLRMNGAYGSDGAAWARLQAIVPGRLLKLGAQVSF